MELNSTPFRLSWGSYAEKFCPGFVPHLPQIWSFLCRLRTLMATKNFPRTSTSSSSLPTPSSGSFSSITSEMGGASSGMSCPCFPISSASIPGGLSTIPKKVSSSSTGVHTSGISSFSICLLTEASSYLALVTYSFTSSSPEFLSSHSLSLRSLSSRLHWILATILCADLTYSSPLSFTAHRPSICLSSLGIPEEAAMETTQLRSECSVQSLYNSGSSSGPLPDTHRPSSKKHSLSLEYTTLVITTKSS